MIPEDLPPIEAVADREPPPPWTLAELLFFVGILVTCMVASLGLALGVAYLAGIGSGNPLPLVLGELLGYSLAFTAYSFYFRTQHSMSLFEALRWRRTWFSPAMLMLTGASLALSIALLGSAMRIPEIDMPIRKYLSNPVSFSILVLASITLAPLFEEWVFRGLLQPTLTRYTGAAVAIVLTSAVFGVLHLPQYGNSWRHGVLLTIAGCGFGWARYAFRSTQASAWMHCGYNLVLSIGLLVASKGNFTK
jgi:membrane protease YdiL (CAAX protease family)